VPRAYAALTLKEFLDRLPELDDAWQARVADEARRHRVLRYVVSATPRHVTAGLVALPLSDPMATASGTRNLVTFHSRRYRREPLVISGPWCRAGRDRRRHLERHLLAGAAMTQESMLRLILTSRVYDVARSTPLDDARRLSQRTGNRVLLKREDLQPIFTYKLRGAYNRMAHLTAEERERGVIAASAGNHAQGSGVLRTSPRRERPDRDAAHDADDQG
jgi:hypothetical protein